MKQTLPRSPRPGGASQQPKCQEGRRQRRGLAAEAVETGRRDPAVETEAVVDDEAKVFQVEQARKPPARTARPILAFWRRIGQGGEACS